MTNVHENENYIIYVEQPEKPVELGSFSYSRCYCVANRHTGVVEYRGVVFPDVLFYAEQLNHAMLHKSWEWRDKLDNPEKSDPFAGLMN